jgi:integrase
MLWRTKMDGVSIRSADGMVPAPIGKLRGLRHTHASQLLGAGVNIKAVSSRLGHASEALTLSIYARSLRTRNQGAAQRIDDLLSGSKSGMIGLSFVLVGSSQSDK